MDEEKVWKDMLEALKHYADNSASTTFSFVDNDGYEISVKVVAPKTKPKEEKK